MSGPSRRAHARVPCDLRVTVFRGAAIGRRLSEGRLLDLSLSGAYLLYSDVLERGVPYRLSVATPDEALELPFRIMREGPRGGGQQSGARHYGLLFSLSADLERKVRRFMDYLRLQPPTPGEERLDRSMRSYWEL